MSVDGQQVEAAFRAMIAVLDDPPCESALVSEAPVSGAARGNADRPADDGLDLATPVSSQGHHEATAGPRTVAAAQRLAPARSVTIKPIRLRDKEHCKLVARQPCVVCGRTPSDAHHLRFAQPRALGRRVSDEYTIPVCRVHHRELHRYGDEASWWAGVNLDPVPIALALWRRFHPIAAIVDDRTGPQN
jgi:hypothetical protein